MKAITVAALALLASGCATTYGEIGGLMADGASAEQLSADTFRVRSRGNGATEPALVEDYAMLRAAEALKSRCFTHFVILEGADRTEVHESVTPAEWTTTYKEKEVDGKKVRVEHRSFTPESRSVTVRPGQDLVVRGLTLQSGRPKPEGAFSTDEIIHFVGGRVERRRDAPPPLPPVCAGV